jgi:hypothetical protein
MTTKGTARDGSIPQVGDIIRYGGGVSALGKIHAPHAGGFHIVHVLGGFQFVCDHGWGESGIYKPSAADIEFCKIKRPEWFE